MKVITTVLRVLLGVIFVVFGLNGFLHFLPMPPMPGKPGAFFEGLSATNYMLQLIFGTQVIGGALLFAGLFVPLALLLLAPVIVNIIGFHVFLAPSGLPLALVVAALWAYLAWVNREAFAPLLRVRGGE